MVIGQQAAQQGANQRAANQQGANEMRDVVVALNVSPRFVC
jgi:hypothetical protein